MENTVNLKSSIAWSDFKLNSDGMVPVIAQDYQTNEVLMLAYMNEEAFNTTLNIRCRRRSCKINAKRSLTRRVRLRFLIALFPMLFLHSVALSCRDFASAEARRGLSARPLHPFGAAAFGDNP